MKIRSVSFNNRRKGFEVRTWSKTYWYPYTRLAIEPGAKDPIAGTSTPAGKAKNRRVEIFLK